MTENTESGFETCGFCGSTDDTHDRKLHRIADEGKAVERETIVAYLRRDGACDCEHDPAYPGAQHGSILRCMSCLLAEEIEKGLHYGE